eukprot:2271830-Pyramimonas_sp.AAC.2
MVTGGAGGGNTLRGTASLFLHKHRKQTRSSTSHVALGEAPTPSSRGVAPEAAISTAKMAQAASACSKESIPASARPSSAPDPMPASR